MSARGKCRGCGRERHVTDAGMIRRHRNGTAVCSGAGQPPSGSVTAGKPASQPGTVIGPAAPTEPTYGRSCDGGSCNAPSVGWRLYRDLREWLPVCGLHMEGKAGRTRIYDNEADR